MTADEVRKVPVKQHKLRRAFVEGWREGRKRTVLAQDDIHIRRYGEEVIHHRLNGRLTCGLKCNAKVQVTHSGHPVMADMIADRIRQEIYKEAADARD